MFLNISYNYQQVVERGKIVNFCWIPSQIGIHGYNEADMVPKSALQFEVAKLKIPYTALNFFYKMLYKLFGKYFETFVIELNSILFKRKFLIKVKLYNFCLPRQDGIIISKIRI